MSSDPQSTPPHIDRLTSIHTHTHSTQADHPKALSKYTSHLLQNTTNVGRPYSKDPSPLYRQLQPGTVIKLRPGGCFASVGHNTLTQTGGQW